MQAATIEKNLCEDPWCWGEAKGKDYELVMIFIEDEPEELSLGFMDV